MSLLDNPAPPAIRGARVVKLMIDDDEPVKPPHVPRKRQYSPEQVREIRSLASRYRELRDALNRTHPRKGHKRGSDERNRLLQQIEDRYGAHALAAQYGCSSKTVYAIVTRQIYGDID